MLLARAFRPGIHLPRLSRYDLPPRPRLVSPIGRGHEALEALTGNIGELTGQIAAPITRAFRPEGRRTAISSWAQAPDRRRAPRGPRPSATDARRLWARAEPYFRPFRRQVAEIAALSMLVARGVRRDAVRSVAAALARLS